MGEAGMGFKDILASLTTNPAKRFGAEHQGRVANGFDADLAVLAGESFASVRYAIRKGNVVHGDAK
jgi:imidazolonepropionase-like amidohydrolase